MGVCRTGECNEERRCERGVCDSVTLRCQEQQPISCNGNSCPIGQRCNLVFNICVDENAQLCETNGQCSSGFCVNGSCMNVECVSDIDCLMNQECSRNFRCVDILDECQDGDGDGYGHGPCLGLDCDDGDPNVHPGMIENGTVNCGDGIDNDCSGQDALSRR